MSDMAFAWLVRTALAGGVVLLLGWLLQHRLADPARQQRLGEWSLIAALFAAGLCLFPAWLLIPVPLGQKAPVAMREEAAAVSEPAEAWEFVVPDLAMEEGKDRHAAPAVPETAGSPLPVLSPKQAWWEPW